MGVLAVPWLKNVAVWQEESLKERVEAGGGWGVVLDRVRELGWTMLVMRCILSPRPLERLPALP